MNWPSRVASMVGLAAIVVGVCRWAYPKLLMPTSRLIENAGRRANFWMHNRRLRGNTGGRTASMSRPGLRRHCVAHRRANALLRQVPRDLREAQARRDVQLVCRSGGPVECTVWPNRVATSSHSAAITRTSTISEMRRGMPLPTVMIVLVIGRPVAYPGPPHPCPRPFRKRRGR